MNGNSRILSWPVLLFIITLLFGCGGGGSTDTGSTDTDPTSDSPSYTDPTHTGPVNPDDDDPVDTGPADDDPVDTNPGDPANGNGVATLSWIPPTTNLDGSALTNLEGYKIYYGTQSGSYPNVITIDNPGLSAYVVENLQPNTYYFAMTAYNTSGNESPHSNEASKTVR